MMPKFAATKELDGFDKIINPHWLMVGLNTEKSVFSNNGNQSTIKMRHSEIAEIIDDAGSFTPQQRIITVRGKRKGTTFLDVFDGNVRKTALEICVKTRREVKVSFHYVFDKNDLGTKRIRADLEKVVDFINDKIFFTSGKCLCQNRNSQ